MSSLEDAFETGFQDIGLLTSDADLQAVRALPEFKPFLQKQQQRPAVRAARLNQRGALLHRQGKYSQSIDLFRQALEICRQLYPKAEYPQGHPDLAQSLNNLGFLLNSQGEYGEARDYLAEAHSMYQNLAESFVATASEAEALNFLATLPGTQDVLVSVWWELDEPADDLYTSLWRGRRAVQRIISGRQQALGTVDDPQVQTRYRQYLDTRRALARLMLAPAEAKPKRAAARLQRLSELTTQKERLERELADSVPEFRRQLAARRSRHVELVKHLPPNAVFIDLFGYVRYKQNPDRPGKKGESYTRSYVAFLLRRGQPVVRVDLGPAGPIDKAVADWRRDIIAGKRSPAAETLRRLVWVPIAKELPEEKVGRKVGRIGNPSYEYELDRVYLCPDGRLTAVPWAALPGPTRDSVLLENYAIATVPHGQFLLAQLLKDKTATTSQGTLLAIGDVSFDDKPAAITQPSELASRSAVRGEQQLQWPKLAGTRQELETILALAGNRPFRQLSKNQNVIASLWKVNDQATAALMRLFYYNLWIEKKPPLQALREAQLALYHNPDQIEQLATTRGPNFQKVVKVVSDRRSTIRNRTAPTKTWAAFTLSGMGK